MLTPTTAPPPSISPEAHAELTSRTPASFSDIPPILRWEDDAAVEIASPSWTHWPASEGVANGAADGEPASTARVPGRLYVTEDAVTFLPSGLTGWTLRFPALTLHALTPAGARPAHIYCQIDEGAADEEEEYASLSEMRIFVPAEKLESLFVALSSCSALHDSLLPSGEPASFFGFGDDDDDDDAFEDADEGAGRPLGDVSEAEAAEDARAMDQDEAEDEVGDGDGDPEVDAVTAFLARVDWAGVPPPSGWEDVDEGAQLAAARRRVAQLEGMLAEERARVAALEARAGGQFEDA